MTAAFGPLLSGSLLVASDCALQDMARQLEGCFGNSSVLFDDLSGLHWSVRESVPCLLAR